MLLHCVSIRFGLGLILICSQYHIFNSHTVISTSINYMMVRFWMNIILICTNNKVPALQRHMFLEHTDITSCWCTLILSCSDPSYTLILIDTIHSIIHHPQREIRVYMYLYWPCIFDAPPISFIWSINSSGRAVYDDPQFIWIMRAFTYWSII